MHIAVFSQYHTNPDCPATSRHYTLLAYIARTHRVTLITTRTWEQQQLTNEFAWVPKGVELRAAQVPYQNQMGVLRRGLAFGQYAAYALREGLRIDKPDVIWGISTPLTAAWAAAQVARWRQVPWVFEVQDLWPSFPIAMGAVPNRLAQRGLFALEKSLYQSASHVLPLSPDMTQYVRELGVPTDKLTTVLNGTDLNLAARATNEAVAALRQEVGLAGRQVILYAGTFGRANNMAMLVEAAVQLAATCPSVTWLFMGHGFDEKLLQQAAAQHAFIRLVPPQPRHAVFTWFRLADVSVVSFLGLPVLDANSPAKLYDSLAVGTPVVVTNTGWTRHLVETTGCGWYSPASDASSLAALLENLFQHPEKLRAAGAAGKALAASTFDRQQLANVVQQVLEKAVK
ncbi:glycosyltransferase family 4 protein [Hymenobacter sp. BT186]|uniref:Glycosyltransferase family 4 protein n=1 Tax=Hymenobacter telluris TaxID=2816474 RepID=A0A939EYM7_9BACT|nr:glycosyltransferase family 4 protein [Hymenobacter telluris]MBW3375895.1 glycosyltransferase family 4 protein [Hymenobacter norwichensis]